MGKRTYDWVMSNAAEFPHRNKKTYVITNAEKEGTANLTFYNGDLKSLIQSLKASEGKSIFCEGGAELVNSLLAENLIDEMIISVIPVLLGDGIKLFKQGLAERKLKLMSSLHFESGLVQLHYGFEQKH